MVPTIVIRVHEIDEIEWTAFAIDLAILVADGPLHAGGHVTRRK